MATDCQRSTVPSICYCFYLFMPAGRQLYTRGAPPLLPVFLSHAFYLFFFFQWQSHLLSLGSACSRSPQLWLKGPLFYHYLLEFYGFIYQLGQTSPSSVLFLCYILYPFGKTTSDLTSSLSSVSTIPRNSGLLSSARSLIFSKFPTNPSAFVYMSLNTDLLLLIPPVVLTVKTL